MTSVAGVAVSPPVVPRREDVAEVRAVPKVEEAPKAPEAPKEAPKAAPKRAEAPEPVPEAEGWRDQPEAPAEPPRPEVRAYWDTIEQTQPGRPGSTFRENF